MQGNRGGRVCGGADTSSRNAAVSDRRAPPFENLTSLRPSRQRFDTFRVAGLGKILSVCRGWRRQPPISPWPARQLSTHVKSTTGCVFASETLGSSPRGWRPRPPELSVCRGWRRQPPIFIRPVTHARDRCGVRGGGPAGWVPVGRRSAVRAPKLTKP